MSDISITAHKLSKQYRLGQQQLRYKTVRESLMQTVQAPFRRLLPGSTPPPRSQNSFWALKDVSFTIRRGEVVGIIGCNGAGKSTLLKILSRITDPTEGSAEIRGRIGSLLEVGTGFHPELTGRENIYLNGAILGMRHAEIRRKFDEIVAFSEVEKFIDTPVKHYSSGMYLRLAFAVAAHLEPEVLLVDEVLAVGDAAFQKKCLGKMEDVAKKGRTVLYVSHNMGAVRALCSEGIVLHQGKIVRCGDVGDCIRDYYSQIGILQSQSPETQNSAPAPSSRAGFGQIRLDDSPGNTVDQSQPFTLASTFLIDRPISGFWIYCILEDMQCRTVFHLREESALLGIDKTVQGSYSVRVRLPPLWLNPGLYSVHLKIQCWGDQERSKFVSDKFPLDIAGTSSAIDGPVLHPKAAWTLSL